MTPKPQDLLAACNLLTTTCSTARPTGAEIDSHSRRAGVVVVEGGVTVNSPADVEKVADCPGSPTSTTSTTTATTETATMTTETIVMPTEHAAEKEEETRENGAFRNGNGVNGNNKGGGMEGKDEEDDEDLSCEELYGPYPRAIPVPFVTNSVNEGREGDIPSKEVLDSAKTMFDVPADYRDKNTPDSWIPRDGRLVRLTGKHPFNVEPPVDLLAKHGFITPSSLHYVRNHGACPKLSWDEHKIFIGGPLVGDEPVVLRMDDLVRMADDEGLGRELPVTLVCAGNRRKEQNMIRQTIGFNWGPSGVSTNVWKGVLLRDILMRHVPGMSDRPKFLKNKHVEFVGVEDLPNKVGPGPFVDEGHEWGKQVKYGTSIPLSRAINPAYDVLIAYEANGERLQPDHGFPVRLIIPGYIGGRMIKWLDQINVIPYETRNHYHYHDNRILPPHITSDESLRGNWWYKPEYIFNELNINSAIARPHHNETISVVDQIHDSYPVTGYAYTGGGRKITRVEVSFNQGDNWHLTELDRKEHPTPYGMYWCWLWWTFRIPVSRLIGCKEIWCRAWDESNNTQPINPTWNLMGMGNNHVFRVKVHSEVGNGSVLFKFEHPTNPGQQTQGWMTKTVTKPESAGFGKLLDVQGDADGGADGGAAAASPPPTANGQKNGNKAANKTYTLEEIDRHNKVDDCWIIVKDRVYDCTEYLELHPGGVESIVMNGGALDATEDFFAIHSTKAKKMMEKYYIGDVDRTPSGAAAAASNGSKGDVEVLKDEQGRLLALNPKKKVSLKLQEKIVLSRDSMLLNFALPTKDHILGLPTGKHVFMSAVVDGELVLRRYTPVSSNYDVGCVKFVIKVYRPIERFPRGGKMTQYLDTLRVGDALDFRGPVGEFEYLGDGNFKIENKPRAAAKFNMIAGGTGITPCMQVAAEILRNAGTNGNDRTNISLIYACREEGDLLLRDTLEEWEKQYPSQFKVHYILSDSWSAEWKYSKGFVDAALFKEYLYEPSGDVYTLMCGPPIMIDRGCLPNLKQLGHDDDRMFCF